MEKWMSGMPVWALSQPPCAGLAGGISVFTPLTLGSHRYDSCRGGAEGHRPACGGGCFCLWKRGRKRQPMPPHGVRCSPASAAFPRSLWRALTPVGAVAAPACALEDTRWARAALTLRPELPSGNAPSYHKMVRFSTQQALLWKSRSLANAGCPGCGLVVH